MNQKRHLLWAEINVDAIRHNFQNIKKLLKPETKVAGVIKANAYGHGAVNYAKALIKEGVDFLMVARLEEAIELRHSNIESPILILGYVSDDDAKEVIEYDLSTCVYTYELAKLLNDEASKQGKKAKLHIKIDTGMTRIGFLINEESFQEIERIQALPNVCLEGLFTHFACADEKDKQSAKEQAARFEGVVQELKRRGIEPEIVHCANSAATMDLTEFQYGMVRVGILLYGIYPSDEVLKERLDLRPVMTFKARVTEIKEVPENTGVSYGFTFVTKRKTKIASLAVGYADGYQRSFSNKASIIVNGMRAPQIGRICMDQCMVDITDVKGEVKMGDEVIIFGDDQITVNELAEIANTIPYELICAIQRRVPRVYVDDEGNILGTVSYLD